MTDADDNEGDPETVREIVEETHEQGVTGRPLVICLSLVGIGVALVVAGLLLRHYWLDVAGVALIGLFGLLAVGVRFGKFQAGVFGGSAEMPRRVKKTTTVKTWGLPKRGSPPAKKGPSPADPRPRIETGDDQSGATKTAAERAPDHQNSEGP
jgi:hypothetical protein